MEWIVLKIILTNHDFLHRIIVQSGKLTMQIEAKSAVQINCGDTLYPLKNAMYCLNRKEAHQVKIIKAEPFPANNRK